MFTQRLVGAQIKENIKGPSHWSLCGYSFTTLDVTVYPKKYAHDFCFAVLCCGYTLTDFPISIRLTSLALWQSNDCPSASKATLMNIDKYFMWIHYERLHNHNKGKHNKTVCIFLGIDCRLQWCRSRVKASQTTGKLQSLLGLTPKITPRSRVKNYPYKGLQKN